MDNLKIYSAVRAVPKEAQKIIAGGKLKGFTDINPMWRIKVLTEIFGVCGIGWKYDIVSKEIYPAAQGEVVAVVDINLYIKDGGKWSDPIPGTGGSKLVSSEKGSLVASDECFKMALTDALSVSCKALGVAADIYYANDRTKYTASQEPPPVKPKTVEYQDGKIEVYSCKTCGKRVMADIALKSLEANGEVFCSGTCKNA